MEIGNQNVSGLSKKEINTSRFKFGRNVLPKHKVTFFSLLLRQFKSVFNYLLFVAALIAFFLGETLDAGFILLFVVLGVGIGLYQEYKSNKISEQLQSFLQRHATVIRDGKEADILVEDIVVGDVIVLEHGDIVPADAKIIHAEGMLVDETTFTGENVSIPKFVNIQDSSDTSANNVLQGTVVVRGSALAEVTAVGSNTKLARIVDTTQIKEEKSVLTKSVDRISIFILRATLITLLFVIIGNVLIDGTSEIPILLVFAISLAVSVIPEALPLVAMFSLSRGALRLAQQKVIVKRLTSVQDLGSITVLCTDKTGTITENKLAVVNEYYVPGSAYTPYFLARCAANDVNERIPEPFDIAVINALSEEDKSLFEEFTVIEEEPFEPELRSNGATLRHSDGRTIHLRRGSPEYILSLCNKNDDDILKWINTEESQGRRVIAVSYDNENTSPQLGGLLSFFDQLKGSTHEAIAEALDLHIDVRIITGDAKLVAEAVGRSAGIVKSEDQVMTATELFSLPPHEVRTAIDSIKVFARTTPEQKLEILKLLKEKHIVGFLGEGINDVPALKVAHVSMVVESASDVARETADIILLNSDLKVIVEGVRLGRETAVNVFKYIRATLVSNFGNFYAIAMASFFIAFLPMLPKQILALNLLSDFPMMAIAYDRVSRAEIARPHQNDMRSLTIVIITLGLISTVFDFLYFGLFYHISPEVLQTNWFIASIITEILLIFSIRSELPVWKAGLPSPVITFLSVGALCLAVLIPVIPVTSEFFSFTTPTASHLVIIASLGLLYLATTEVAKNILYRYLKERK